MAEPQLQLQSVSAGYGETVVLEGIDLEVGPGESVSVLGRNGVGKTTLLETVMGHTQLHRGRILVAGHDVGRLTPYQRVWQGLGLVPQEREIFPSLTVHENLSVSARPGPWTINRVLDLFPQLHERRAHVGAHLSGGEQQMLAVARALVGNPAVLLMDEPSEGLAPVVVEILVGAMRRLRDEEAMAIVLVEQNSRIALDFAPRALVMNRGRIVHDGESRALARSPGMLDRLIGVDPGSA